MENGIKGGEVDSGATDLAIRLDDMAFDGRGLVEVDSKECHDYVGITLIRIIF